MTAPLTDAQVAALREAAEKLVALDVSWHVPWRIRAGAMANGVRVEVSEYVHALSPDVILALLAERDALKAARDATIGAMKALCATYGRMSCGHDGCYGQSMCDDTGHWKFLHCWQCRAESAEAALSALRARETGLRELAERWRAEAAEYPTATDERAAMAAVSVRLCSRELEAALSAPAVHGASEAER